MEKRSIKGRLVIVACMAALTFSGCNQQAETKKEGETAEAETSAEAKGEFGGRAAERSRGMMPLMHENMKKMRGIKITGDPDYDFAQMMKLHHQGAIRISEEEIGNGTDNTLKQLADKIISTNNSDITRLQTFLDANKPGQGDTALSMKMMQPMKKMMGDLPRQTTGSSTDENYAHMMIQHHQSGIGMAEELLKQGRSREMKSLAQQIIDEQRKDIKELEGWLSENQNR
ncbi:DUF305 domain-containing protein [Pontibacter ruber]|uniref:DUF305 domain-containing protein n=2 Tax=Pontibacter ruber TaxID=1343895 RepID=A0ABW5CZB6_9BACT